MAIEKVVFPIPQLIVNEYQDKDEMRRKIVYGKYSCIDNIVPMVRNRGTVLEVSKDTGEIRITGWQRDITRMRKQDVSLSFIIYLVVNKAGVVEEVDIDDSFNGGKGLLCSREYLLTCLKNELEGKVFEVKIARRLRLRKLKCFHIHEVINSIYSTYFIYKEQREKLGEISFHEEDTLDVYAKEGNLFAAGVHEFKGLDAVRYTICFYDMFNSVTFDEDGYMKIIKPVQVDFYINDSLVHKDIVDQKENDHIFIKFQIFVMTALEKFQNVALPGYDRKIMNTNLSSSAFIGAIMQAVGIRIFSNNFNYIQYLMTALQRPRGKPGCLGAILIQEEADKFFKGFNMDNLT